MRESRIPVGLDDSGSLVWAEEDREPTMRRSQLIESLRERLDRCGDLPIYAIWEGQVKKICEKDIDQEPGDTGSYGFGFLIDVDT